MSHFLSDIGNMLLIDDDFATESLCDDGGGRGRVPRDFAKEPFGSLPFAGPFDLPLIPRSEWSERIEAIERSKSRLTDLCDVLGVKVKNQQQTNYCWINAPVHCLEIIRAVQGQKYVELSPASVGAKIKGFRNEGGWGTEGLRYLVDHGCVPTSLWPANAIDRKYDNHEADAARAHYQVDEWYDLQPRSFVQLMTCLFHRFPVAIGLNWWGHEVTAMNPVKLDGSDRFGVTIDNSWGTDWGENGRSVLSESKATPDDAVAPRVGTAS